MTCSKERFLYDVRDHKMTVHKDDAVMRHLTFKRPGTSIYRFHLTTWPGYLGITGDCDDFVFTRLHDMFEFFRSTGRPDHRYWSEKAVAVSKTGGIERFSEDRYEEVVRHISSERVQELSPADARKFEAEVQEQMLGDWDKPAELSQAVTLGQEFRCPVSDYNPFLELWDYNLKEYTFGFTWACWAIQWGIKQYDLHKTGATQEDHDRAVLAGVL